MERSVVRRRKLGGEYIRQIDGAWASLLYVVVHAVGSKRVGETADTSAPKFDAFSIILAPPLASGTRGRLLCSELCCHCDVHGANHRADEADKR